MNIHFKLFIVAFTFAVLCGTNVATAEESTATVWQGDVAGQAVVVIDRWITVPADGHYTVQVRRSTDGVVIDIPLTASVGQFTGAWVWNQRLLVFINDEASVVDLESYTLADQFLAQRPAVSPDGRFVVYQRFVPRYVDNDEGVYLAYDVSKSAAENRMSGSSDNGIALEENAGTAVFPEWNVAHLAYFGRTAQDGERVHELRSTLTWVDNDSLVFIDWSRPISGGPHTLSAVRIDIGTTLNAVSVRTQDIDATELIDGGRYSDPPSHAADAFYANGVELLECTATSCRLRIAVSNTPGRRVSVFEIRI